jgi:hypothetical protein
MAKAKKESVLRDTSNPPPGVSKEQEQYRDDILTERARLMNKMRDVLREEVQEIRDGLQQILKSVADLRVPVGDSYFAIEQMSEQRQWRLRSLKALSLCLGLPVVAVVLSVSDGPNNVQTKIKIGF